MARRSPNQERQLSALLKKLQPSVRKAFLHAMRTAATAVDKAALIQALEARNIVLAMELLRINQQTLFPVAEAVRTAYLEAGASVAVLLPIRLRGQFGFGGNPRSVAAVQQITSEMTEYLSQSTTEAVREAIIRAVDTGVPPAETARDLVGLMDRRTGIRSGGIMNLDAQRAEQAQKVKDMLGDKDKIRRYFIKDSKTGKMKPRYKSTDRTFDKRIREAIKAGRALPKSDIDAISNRHISRLLLDRGKQIARDNTLTALRSGRHNGFIELVESGLGAHVLLIGVLEGLQDQTFHVGSPNWG